MKANEVATKNHVTFDDILEICRELNIPCENETADLSEREVFLVDKKIESVKKRKLEEAQKAKKKQKIKLKKDVKLSSDLTRKIGKEVPPKESEHKDRREATAGEEENVKSGRPQAKAAGSETKISAEKAASLRGKPSAEGAAGGQRRAPSGERSERPQGDRPRPQGDRPRPQGDRPRPQGDRPRPQGDRPRPQGDRQRPQGDRPRPQGDRQRPQGDRPRPQGDRQRPQGDRQRPQGDRQRSQGARDGRPQSQGGDIRKRFQGGQAKDDAPVALEIDDQAAKKSKGKEKELAKEKEKEKAWIRQNRKDREDTEKALTLKKKQAAEQRKSSIPDKISITESVTVGELAKKLNVKANDVISKLMKLGVMATINQAIDSDTAAILASEYNAEVGVVSLYDETVIKTDQEDRPEDHVGRSPVVAVMGHVDHGKTRLLDSIRKSNVIDSEFGGITQHIGAYTVNVKEKKITFLDTPGHAAFTTMRARGAKITDIVILVVAANDGVMPQTIEAINHAKAAGVPIIVAINKIDLPEANSEKVKQELTAYDLIPEEWGGTTLIAEISAKQGTNIEDLLELVLIQAEMLELNANPKLLAKGAVVESKLDPGRGAVSTVLVQSGTLHVGDYFVVGIYSGKVRAMFDDKGKQIEEAGPSIPVEILGISGVSAAGDPFECVESDKTAKQVSQKRMEYKRIEAAKKVRKVTLESLNEMIKEGEVQDLNIIVKGDVDGSTQALTEALEKLSNEEVRVRVIHSGTGGINDSDVMLASASNAIIIGYHVRPTGKVADLAEKENVSIKFYNIIFEATDDIKAAMEGMLSPVIEQKVLGTGEIRQIFKVSKIGTIAGSVCLGGKIIRKAKMRLIRDGVVIYDGELASLKRFKDDVVTVESGQEFGFSLENFNDIKEGDTFEAYEIVETAKKL